MDLEDLPTGTIKFSWSRGSGGAMSILDKFLLSRGFVSLLSAASQEIEVKDVSDHSPIWHKCKTLNWGPKRFRYPNGWLEHPGFMEFVDKEWKYMVIRGSKTFVVKEKLKHIKASLRRWNVGVFGWIYVRVEEEINQINLCDDRFVTFFGNQGALGLINAKAKDLVISEDRAEATCSFWNNIQRHEFLIKQKSRIKWCKEGDLNTRFFHN